MSGPGTRQVEFFFDPSCPFCWQTSKWFRQVRRQADITAHWRLISLAILNGEDDQEDQAEGHEIGLRFLRVIAAARRDHGDEVVGPLYEAIGTRMWETATEVDGPVGDADVSRVRTHHQRTVLHDLSEIIDEVGLPVELAAAADDEQFDEELRASTDEAMERTGGDVGTPILSFDPPDGPALFGPVISMTPSDEEAVELWDAVTTLAHWPSFAELKRSLGGPIDNEFYRSLAR